MAENLMGLPIHDAHPAMRRFFSTAVVLAVCTAHGTGLAQQAPAAPCVDCPASAKAAVPIETLYGRWEVRFDGLPGTAIVQLGKHPDYEGVRGMIVRSRGGPASQLAGDLSDDGALLLDESEDGRSISAVWELHPQPGLPGRELQGTWRHAGNDNVHQAVMRRIPDRP